MSQDKLPKSVPPEGDKSRQAERTSNPQPHGAEKPASPASREEVSNAAEPGQIPDAPYGDPGMKPDEIPIASDPDPEVDPYVSRDAAQPIGTGREDQAIAERKAAAKERQVSPEMEADKENPRIHGQHHEKVGGRPLESFAPDKVPHDPHRPAENISGLNPHTSNYSGEEVDE